MDALIVSGVCLHGAGMAALIVSGVCFHGAGMAALIVSRVCFGCQIFISKVFLTSLLAMSWSFLFLRLFFLFFRLCSSFPPIKKIF